MKKTTQDISMNFRGHEITIPAGTEITNKTAVGIDENYNFVADLGWIKPLNINGEEVKNYTLIHDATYYGINVPKEFVTND